MSTAIPAHDTASETAAVAASTRTHTALAWPSCATAASVSCRSHRDVSTPTAGPTPKSRKEATDRQGSARNDSTTVSKTARSRSAIDHAPAGTVAAPADVAGLVGE